MSHVLQCEHFMPVGRLLKLLESENVLAVLVRCKGLPDSEDSTEPLQQVYEDVPGLLLKLLARRNNPPALSEKARAELRP